MRPLLAIAVLAAVVYGGFIYGVINTLTDDPTDW